MRTSITEGVTGLNSFTTGFLSYRNQSINVLCKSMDWFLYDSDLRQERVNTTTAIYDIYFNKPFRFTDISTTFPTDAATFLDKSANFCFS